MDLLQSSQKITFCRPFRAELVWGGPTVVLRLQRTPSTAHQLTCRSILKDSTHQTTQKAFCATLAEAEGGIALNRRFEGTIL